eukprot:14048018-Alexandrium_andersonii.AAC.1
MKALGKQRRATHMDEIERFQMEEAILESLGQQAPAAPVMDAEAAARAAPTPAREPSPTRTPPPRTTQLLRE